MRQLIWPSIRHKNAINRTATTQFDQRRDWIRQYLPRLCGLFAVEAGFHVEMSNHLHLLLRSLPDVVDTWSDEDVVERWKIINRLIHSSDGQTYKEVSEGAITLELALPGRVEELRKNLSSVAQFMKALCQHIARRANREDGCTGLFSRAVSTLGELSLRPASCCMASTLF